MPATPTNSATIGHLIVRMLLDDSAYQASIGKFTANSQKLRFSIAPVIDAIGSGLVTALKGATLAAAGLAAATAVLGSSFERQMAHLAATKGIFDRTSDDYKRLEAHAKEMGATTVFSASQAAEAMVSLAQAGMDVEQIIRTTKPALDMAVAGQITLERSTSILASTMKQFNIDTGEAGHVAEVFAQASQMSLLSVDSLAEAMKYAGTAGASIGSSLEETVAVLAMFKDLGLEASTAGTNFRRMIQSLADPTEKAQDILHKLGFSAADVSPSLNSLSEILVKLGKSEMTIADAFGVFDIQAGANVKKIATDMALNMSHFNELLGKLKNGTGALADIVAMQTDTVWAAWDEVLSAAENGAIMLFDAARPSMMSFLEQVRLTFGYVADEIQARMPEIQRDIGEVFGGNVGGREFARGLVDLIKGALDFMAILRRLTDAMIPLIGYFDDLILAAGIFFAVGKVTLFLQAVSSLFVPLMNLGEAAIAAATAVQVLGAAMTYIATVGGIALATAAVMGLIHAYQDLSETESEYAAAKNAQRAAAERSEKSRANQQQVLARRLGETTIIADQYARLQSDVNKLHEAGAKAAREYSDELLAVKLNTGELIRLGDTFTTLEAGLRSGDPAVDAAIQEQRRVLSRSATMAQQSADAAAVEYNRLVSAYNQGTAWAYSVAEAKGRYDALQESLEKAKGAVRQFEREVSSTSDRILQEALQDAQRLADRKAAEASAAAQDAKRAERLKRDSRNREAEEADRERLKLAKEYQDLLDRIENDGLDEWRRILKEKEDAVEKFGDFLAKSAAERAIVEQYYAKKAFDAWFDDPSSADIEDVFQAALGIPRYRTPNEDFWEGPSVDIRDMPSDRRTDFEKSGAVFGPQAGQLSVVVGRFGRAIDGTVKVVNIARDVFNGVVGTVQDVIGIFTGLASTVVNVIEKFTGLDLNLFGFVKSAQAIYKDMVGVGGVRPSMQAASTQAVTNAVNESLSFIAAVVQAAPDIMRALADQLPMFLRVVISAIPEVVNAVVGQIPVLIDSFVANIGPLTNQLVSAGERIVQVIIDKLPEVVDALVSSFENNIGRFNDMIVALIMAIIDQIDAIVIALVNGLKNLIHEILNNIGDIIQGIIESLMNMLINDMSVGQNIVFSIIRAIPDIIKGILNGLVDAIPKLIESIGPLISDLLSEIVKTFVSLFTNNGLIDIVTGLIQGIIGALPELITSLVALIPQLVVELVNGLIAMLPEIWNNVADSLIGGPLTRIIGAILQALAEAFVELWSQLGDMLAQAFEDLFLMIFNPKEYQRQQEEKKKLARDNRTLTSKELEADLIIRGGLQPELAARAAEAYQYALDAGLSQEEALAKVNEIIAASGEAEAQDVYNQMQDIINGTTTPPSNPVGGQRRPEGSYASGIEYVPRAALVRVHAGERILTREENSARRVTSPGGVQGPAMGGGGVGRVDIGVIVGEREIARATVDACRLGRAPELNQLLRRGSGAKVGLARPRFNPYDG